MNYQTIITILFFIAVAIFAIIDIVYLIKKNGLKSTVRQLILEAEDKFEKGMNDEKMNFCIQQFINKLPAVVQYFVTYESVKNFIQGIFNCLKQAMDYTPKEVKVENEKK